MAKSQLPGAKTRRRMLRDKDPALAQAGRGFVEAGRWGEALECLEACPDQEALEELTQAAWEAGDLFYWRQGQRLLGHQPTAAELEELAQRAEAAGKPAFAQSARGLVSGDGEGA